MTAVELLREARAIVPPAGASRAIAVHDGTHHRAAFLVNGRIRSAPVGPAFDKPREACAFVDVLNGDTPAPRPGQPDLARLGADRRDTAGQTEAPDGSVHPSPGGEPTDASQSIPTLEPGPEPLGVAPIRSAVAPGVPVVDDVAVSAAPSRVDQADGDPAGSGRAIASASPGSARCAACGRDLASLPPSPMAGRRKTCSDACRQAYRRGHRAPVPGVVDDTAIERLSRLPDRYLTGFGHGDPDPAPDPNQLAMPLSLERTAEHGPERAPRAVRAVSPS